jgi:hypothetical protein
MEGHPPALTIPLTPYTPETHVHYSEDLPYILDRLKQIKIYIEDPSVDSNSRLTASYDAMLLIVAQPIEHNPLMTFLIQAGLISLFKYFADTYLFVIEMEFKLGHGVPDLSGRSINGIFFRVPFNSKWSNIILSFLGTPYDRLRRLYDFTQPPR